MVTFSAMVVTEAAGTVGNVPFRLTWQLSRLLCYSTYSRRLHHRCVRFSGDSRTPHQLENFYLVCGAEHKLATLVRLLQERVARAEKVMVFLSTCAMVEYFTVVVRRYGNQPPTVTGPKRVLLATVRSAQICRNH